MKASKVFVKRSQSPSQPPNTIQISERKKKSSTNMHLQSVHNNQPKKTVKQFDTHANKTQKKKNNYLKQLLKSNNQQTNKYRIVTEPVEERLLYLGNSNFGNNSGNGLVRMPISSANVSAVIKVPSKSKSRLQQQQQQQYNNHRHQYTEKYLKLNIRTSQQSSKQKVKTGESFHYRLQQNPPQSSQQCRNCERYKQQLENYRKQLNKICMDKTLWKSGQLHIDDVKESLFGLSEKRKMKSIEKNRRDNNNGGSNCYGSSKYNNSINNNHNNNSQQKHRHKTTTTSTQKQVRYHNNVQQYINNTNTITKVSQFTDSDMIKYRSPLQQKHLSTSRTIDYQLGQLKKHILDLMRDIESLSAIDYPKMLSLNIFHYDPFYMQNPSAQQEQLKSMLSQLRISMEGKVFDQEIVDNFGNSDMSEHNRMIFRNLKSRLGYYLRENLQLKIKKEVLERSEEITKESEDYLKKVVEDVLLTYVNEIGGE